MRHLLSPAPIPRAFVHLLTTLEGQPLSSLSLPAHSYTRNFYNYALMAPSGLLSSDSTWGDGHGNFKDTTGNNRVFYAHNYAWTSVNPAQDNTHGIVVGTSDTAESFDHVSLQAIIAHGTNSGQLSHRVMSAATLSWAAGSKTFSLFLSRIFDNSSGGTIVVKETGIIASCYSQAYKFLYCRDVLASPISVLNSGTLTVTYEAQLVYP